MERQTKSPPGKTGRFNSRLARARSSQANTGEQALLAALVYAGLASTLPSDWLAALPPCAAAFVIGHVGFAWGVGRPARHRAFGFAVTFHSALSGLIVTAALSAASLVP